MGLLVVACGGYRSGSTLSYNLVGRYAEVADLGRRVGYLEPAQMPRLVELWSVVEAMGTAVGKTHQSPALPEGWPGWADLLADGRARAYCTVRDFRDTLHSFCRLFGGGPDEVLASRRWRVNVDNLRWWVGHGAVPVRYEHLHGAPVATLRALVRALGLPLVDAAVAVAVESVGARVADPGDDAVDPRSLVHPGHVATPGGGGWREWEPAVQARVEERVEPLEAEFRNNATPDVITALREVPA